MAGHPSKRRIALLFACAALACAASRAASARDPHGGGGPPGGGHRPPVEHWHEGRWEHSHRGGHLGWWWVVGPAWFYYQVPIYPYPDPVVPPAEIAPLPPSAPAPAQYWYYCDDSAGYYPYVTRCPRPWRAVPVTPPGAP